MTELALVLSMGGILVLSFLYLRRVERSPVSLYWAASWALLFSAGILSNVAFGQPWTACASTVLGTLFAWCLLAGAIAFANLPIPRWLLPAGACLGLIQSATLFLVGPPAYLLTLPFEIPAIGLAAVLLIRAARQRHTSLPERLLGPTLVVLASIDSVDAIVRSNSADTTPIVVLWLSAMLVVALAQILSVVERARDREQALATELERSRKLETVGRLAGGIAHDFNNELTSILGNASLIRSRVDFDPVLGDAITDLERAAEHCAELTQGLLAFARQVPNHPCSLEVEPVLRKVESTLRPSLPEDVSLDVLVDAGILPLLANATQLHRALTNLVVNARDAVGKTGHIQIRARARPRVSDTGEESRLEDARDWIEVSIRDDGPGMDEPTRAHAFDPFFTTKPVGQGTGLGLAIAYGIVTSHGGKIDVESAPGEGTEFRLLWPTGRHEDVAAASIREAPPSGSETILLAEDEPNVRSLARRALEDRGFRVIEAEDGEAAIDRMREHGERIDLALLDLAMPRRDGLAALQVIHSIAPDLPAILMSGHPARDMETRFPPGLELLQKPFRPEELVSRVRRVLNEADRMTPTT